MKKLTIVLFIFICRAVHADEGMWMPQLIEAMKIKDMKKNGFKLSAKDIYDINKASMKDAVAIFGGGCTAELISNKGLILTNHHCGYSSIAGLSTVEKDYLSNGYFAMSAKDEIPCKGLTVTFIKSIKDVTAEVMANVQPSASEKQKDSITQVNMALLEKNAKGNSHYETFIRGFYYGNEYYLFTTEVFTDVRLVGAPPESIGKFGGETDNWVWPRHNADFSMFRIYANKDNKPAEISPDNVPYVPSYFFPISLKGVQENDFTMVYGFPGRTQEYLTSYAVELLMSQQDPIRVELREKRLDVMEEDMKKNDTIRLQYANRYASVANAYKKWKGEMLGLKKTDAVKKKQDFEKKFLELAGSDKTKKDKYATMMSQFEKTYADYAPLSKQYDYFSECLWGIDGLRMCGSFIPVFAELKKKQAGRENKFNEQLKKNTPAIPFKNYNKITDKKLCRVMLKIYKADVDPTLMPDHLDSLYNAFHGNVDSVTDYLYANSRFIDNEKAKVMFTDFEANAAAYEKDPFYQLAFAIFQHYQKTVIPQITYYDKQINELQKEYMKALRETLTDKKFYPDANGTMRITYGKVSDYNGRDGIDYAHFTTLDGLVEKHRTGEEDFAVKPRLVELYEKKDFGQYADKKDGKVHTAFIATNHTTGGNSGSPVINAKGQLIGTNFDRNWEGTMSDIMYNPAFCRNITLDIRFTLWVVDKYAGAGYLIKEMKIVK